MGAEDGLFFAADDPPEPDDPELAWNAAERYAVSLLWHALPEVRSVPAPAAELAEAAARIRSAIRKWPYKHLARAAWGRARLPADDTVLWLDATGAIAAMGHELDVESPVLAPASLLRPADWVGAVIGLVRSGVNVPVTAEDLVRYARRCPEIAAERGSRDDQDGDRSAGAAPGTQAYDPYASAAPETQAYDPFASVAPDDQSLLLAFEAALLFWESVGAVSEQQWLTALGWWGLPRALARAWNGDFDSAGWIAASEADIPEGTWSGREQSPEALGIRRPPPIF